MIFDKLRKMFGGLNEDKLNEFIEQNAVRLDVRSREEFNAGSVTEAINIPLGDLAKGSVKLKRERPIIVFCRSGSRSAMGSSTLKQLGFQQVLNGGSWQNVQSAIDKYKSR
jgi:phage shock protein E